MARLLVIDDEESIRKLLYAVLLRQGHEVWVAESGEQGIELFEWTCPMITILDLHLPDVSGLTVLRRIRAIDPQASILMLTGHGTEEEEIEALTLGAESFLTKGFSLFELGEALRLVMARASKAPVRRETDGSRCH